MPSYIMTGGNFLIEKLKVTMVTEDIVTMLEIFKQNSYKEYKAVNIKSVTITKIKVTLFIH